MIPLQTDVLLLGEGIGLFSTADKASCRSIPEIVGMRRYIRPVTLKRAF